jgi:uncharacterized protein (UPF0210 family)
MPADLSRRDFARLLPLAALLPLASTVGAPVTENNFRLRTITAGLHMQESGGFDQAEAAIAFLRNAREIFEVKGYEVQTLRLATQPLQEYLPDWSSSQSIQAILALDQFAVENEVSCSIGPVFTDDFYHEEFAAWAVEVIRKTKNISFTVSVASAGRGVHYQSLRSAAEAMLAIAHGTPAGEGNFRFAANAFTRAGTPFFPAAYFSQGRSFSIGLESPNLLRQAFTGAANLGDAKNRLKVEMETALGPVAALGNKLATDAQWRYLGIDTSPAPGLDASIGKAIEILTKAPFGSASTLSACAAITDVLKSLSLKTCGYSGLMLPIMEDPVLAQRAAEKRFTVSELLLYSSVCGTGLDVVPIPGNTPEAVLRAILTDVAALATKYQKPLSARLFPVPGMEVGETVSFDNPYLVDAVVMPLA